jgi:2-dehydropantoate 2-reductase
MPDRVYVVGAGGIGCAVGYALLRAGVRVTFVEANPAKVEAGNRDGVRVDDRPPLRAEFVAFGGWQPPPAATVLLCVKCYDNPLVLAKLAADTTLMPIQNGFDPALEAFRPEEEGIASFVSECERDRPHTRITRPGDLHYGSPGGGSVQVSEGFAQVWGTLPQVDLFRAKAVFDIGPFKHTKLMYNAAISPLAAAAGVDNGKLLSVPLARRLFFGLLQENYTILAAAGIELGKVGPFHPRTVAWILRRKWLARLMARRFEPSLRGTYCSMAGEIQKGRTEIDNYNGHLLRLAEQTGTPAPLNRAVYDLVTRMTAERATPRLGVLDELAGA